MPRHFASALLPGALLLAACGGPSDLGGGCALDDPESCVEGLVCAANVEGEPVCSIPVGGVCDVEAVPEEAYCELPTTCSPVEEEVDGELVTVGRCLIPEGEACDPDESYCAEDLTCAELSSGAYACFPPVLFVGRVLDSADQTGIPDARVLGLNDESVAVTDVAISGVDGAYELEVPVVRQEDGAPIDSIFTLRGAADGYQTFPGGIRTALPINTSQAVEDERGWVVEGTITDIVLIELEDPSAPRVSISGTVVADGPAARGVLVVAEAGGVGYTAVSDAQGGYTIFNVPPGDYEVRGYKADLQLVPVGVTASADLVGVDLLVSDAPLTTLNGSINIVNAFGGAVTSVILVVESTFSATFARGEVPPGLRAPRTGPVSISGEWTITGVPDGSYVVLAAFENDQLVRDPDENIAGTDFVVVDLPGDSTTVTLADSFKVTEALDVIGPGADQPEPVSSAPTLEWADDSSEQYYTVVVYNAYGDLVWEDTNVPGVSGAETVSVTYGGPLEPGMYYQFRATSWRSPGGGSPSPISTTEDLRGVFYVE